MLLRSVFGKRLFGNPPSAAGLFAFVCVRSQQVGGPPSMGPSSVGDLPPSRIVELLGNIYRYISKPTGSAGEDFAPTGIDFSSTFDIVHVPDCISSREHEYSFMSVPACPDME